MQKLVIDKPYRVLLPESIDLKMVQKYLTIKNKSIEFQIRRTKNNFRFDYEVPFWKETLDALEAQKQKVLLFEDKEIGQYWTYSGFATTLSKLYKLEIENRVDYPSPKLIPWNVTPKYELRDYQKLALERLLDKKHGAVSIGCHRKGDKVLLYNGYLKKVEKIAVGDKLMGPDSTPRSVLSLCRGVEPIYQIETVNGQCMFVNESHLLVLKRTNIVNKNHKGESMVSSNPIAIISVRDYLKQNKRFKHQYKLFSVSVDFKKKKKLPIDPYFLGLLIGDGSYGKKTSITLTTMDKEIHKIALEQAIEWGVDLKKYQQFNNQSATYVFSSGRKKGGKWYRNKLKEALRTLGMLDKKMKFVPHIYKSSSKPDRLAVLAGLIDTDGSYVDGCFDFISKSKKLSLDVCFLARSVGLRAKISKSYKWCQTGGGGTYWRVYLSGDTLIIPTKLPRKQATPRKQKKNPLMFGFTITKIADAEDYYGFTLDKDRQYLTDSFLVTHNTGLGKSAIFINLIKELSLSSLVVVPTTSIAEQVYNELIERFGKKYVGFFGGTKKESKKLFVVAIAASLNRLNKENPHWQLLEQKQVVIFDESHFTAAKTVESIAMVMCKDIPYRFFFSATQTRTDGQEKLLEGIIGDIVIDMDVKKGVEQGYLAKPVFQIIQLNSRVGYNVQDPNAMERKHLLENPSVAQEAAEIANRFYQAGGLQTLILIDEFVTYDLLKSYLRVPHDFANSGTEVTDQVAKFNKGETPVLIGTSAIALGTDIQTADVLIMIQKGVSEIKFKQAIGRGIRKTTKKSQCVIIDFDITNVPICHKHMLKKADMYEEMIGSVSWIDKRSKYG